jgi:nucleoside-diphosphate-sugar epimerase
MTDTSSVPQSTENTTSVFVTGATTGTGLILIRELVKRGYKVVGTVKTPDEAAKIRRLGALPSFPQLDRVGDVRGLLQMRRVTHVVHLAHLDAGGAPQALIPESAYMTALRATDEIVAAAGQAGVQRILFPSFAYLYGDTHNHAVDENARIQRNTPLLASLADAESAVLDGGIPGYVLRCGYIYGAGTRALHDLDQALRKGAGIASGKNPAAWLHEADLAAALLMLIELPAGADESTNTILNLADETGLTPDAFLKAFAAALGLGEPSAIPGFLTSFRTSPVQRDLLEKSFRVSTEKARALGWTPQYSTPAAGIEQSLLMWRAETDEEPEPEHIPERAIVTL